MYRIKKDKKQEREKEKNCCCTYVVHPNETEGLKIIAETRKNVRRIKKGKKISFLT
jgi:hypothetical protein